MSITFDDQRPDDLTAIAERTTASSARSIEKTLVKIGVAKNERQASMYALGGGLCVIFVCLYITFTVLRPDPIDKSRYYDPITGEPVYASER